MALYDIAVGDGHQHERGAVLLAVLGAPHVARFRDAWVEKSADGPVVAIYTRQGGGNRECYCEDYGRAHPDPSCYAACNEELARHPLYIRDADDDFDSTYATFYFRAPDDPEIRDALASIAQDPVDTDERWQAAIDRIRTGEMRPAETAMADQLGAFLSGPSGGPKVMEV